MCFHCRYVRSETNALFYFYIQVSFLQILNMRWKVSNQFEKLFNELWRNLCLKLFSYTVSLLNICTSKHGYQHSRNATFIFVGQFLTGYHQKENPVKFNFLSAWKHLTRLSLVWFSEINIRPGEQHYSDTLCYCSHKFVVSLCRRLFSHFPTENKLAHMTLYPSLLEGYSWPSTWIRLLLWLTLSIKCEQKWHVTFVVALRVRCG